MPRSLSEGGIFVDLRAIGARKGIAMISMMGIILITTVTDVLTGGSAAITVAVKRR